MTFITLFQVENQCLPTPPYAMIIISIPDEYQVRKLELLVTIPHQKDFEYIQNNHLEIHQKEIDYSGFPSLSQI